MVLSRFSKFTTFMIYGGTFLLSVLSFFTTYYGLSILLDKPLALLGSLGLQTAMLGIAWNLMKIRENRASYVTVFIMTSLFSMFFSYANFDSSLKSNTRATEARREYAAAARPVLNQHAKAIREAVVNGNYQIDRIAALIKMEEEKGWATVVDEGSRDVFVQSVIDGARFMVSSWKEQQGTNYRQGKGRGIIADYLQGKKQQAEDLLVQSKAYLQSVESVTLSFSSELPVENQYMLTNTVCVEFPTSVYKALTFDNAILSSPPRQIDFLEKPQNRQQAFMLVINDLTDLDQLTIFSLLLAIAIDLIVILMALAGSYAMRDDEHVFNRVRHDAINRVKGIPENDKSRFASVLRENLDQFEKASEYGLKLHKVLEEYKDKRNNFRITLKKPSEDSFRPSRTSANQINNNNSDRMNPQKSPSGQVKRKIVI
ncbi:MAG: hypothetical protein KAR42_12765 [candidate division Zixibacteria bacterium]|nr:hypothetical protein [candidate division Zixibacteria bacterium]